MKYKKTNTMDIDGSEPWQEMMHNAGLELEMIESSILDKILDRPEKSEPRSLTHHEAFNISIDIGNIVSHLREYLDENQPTKVSDG